MPQINTVPMFSPSSNGQPSPEEIKQRRALAKALMESDVKDIRSPGLGMAVFAQKALGGFLDEKAARDDRAAEEAAWGPLQKFMESESSAPVPSSEETASSTGFSGAPARVSTGSDTAAPFNPRSVPTFAGGMSDYSDAIAGIESKGSGDYAAVGPRHPKMGRALGRYQVMEANIGPWSREALGREVSADEFMASPEIQDAIFNHKFGQSIQKYGSPEEAASVWFTGKPQAEGGNRRDVFGTTGNKYVQKFRQLLAQGRQGRDPIADARMGGQGPQYAQGTDMGDDGGEEPPPAFVADYGRVRRQMQLGQAMARNPRTRQQGMQLFSQAMQQMSALQQAHQTRQYDYWKHRDTKRFQERQLKSQEDRDYERIDVDRQRLDVDRAHKEAQIGIEGDKLGLDERKFSWEKEKPIQASPGTRGFRLNPQTGTYEQVFEGAPKTPDTQVTIHGDKEMTKRGAEQFDVAQGAAREATKRIAGYGQMAQAMEGFKPGATAEVQLEASKFFKDLGVIEGENVPPAEMFKAVQRRLELLATPKGQGQITENERKLIRETIPSITTSPEGVQQILGMLERLDRYDIEVAKIWRENARKNGGVPNYVEVSEEIMSLPPPMTPQEEAALVRLKEKASAAPAGNNAATKGSQDGKDILRDAMKKKYGLE